MVAYHCAESLFPGGFIGLDVFFVISGYLIGILGYKEIRGRSFSIARFYERRAKRMLYCFSFPYDGPAQQYSRRFISNLAFEYPSIHLIDLRNGLCSGIECRFAERDRSLYWDHEHLTDLGAQIALSGIQIPR